jgi:hypothetical protein
MEVIYQIWSPKKSAKQIKIRKDTYSKEEEKKNLSSYDMMYCENLPLRNSPLEYNIEIKDKIATCYKTIKQRQLID